MCSVQHKNDRFRTILTQFHIYIIPRAAVLCTKMQPFSFPHRGTWPLRDVAMLVLCTKMQPFRFPLLAPSLSSFKSEVNTLERSAFRFSSSCSVAKQGPGAQPLVGCPHFIFLLRH